MKEEKISLWDMLRINRRGINIIYQMIPWNHVWNGVYGLVEVLFCYWNTFFVSRLLNHISLQASREVMFYDVVLLVGGKIVIHIVDRYVMYFYYYCGSNVWELANAHLNRKIMEMDYEYMESENIHNLRRDIDIMARNSGGGINKLFWCLTHVVGMTAQMLIALGYTIYLVYKGHTAFQGKPLAYMGFFILFVSLVALLLILNVRNGRRAERKNYKKNEEMLPYMREFNFYTKEYIDKEECGKNIRMFHQQNLLSQYLKELFGKVYHIIDEIGDIEERRSRYASIIEVLTSGLLYFMLGILVLKEAITVGDVCLYAGCASMFLFQFRYWILELTQIQTNTKYVKMYLDFLDIPNKKYEGTLPVEKRNDDKFMIEFRHVSFRYPGSNVDVLKDFSIKFQIGERLAVVGKNGSGKTTFIKLLCRLYDPTEGEILLNGIDIRKYDYGEYLSLFSVVFQDFKIPAFTVGQNVAAAMEYDEEKAAASLRRVGLAELLDKLPRGLDTPLYKDFDNDGVDISGGEAQKVAIARALYHDSPFVILDVNWCKGFACV